MRYPSQQDPIINPCRYGHDNKMHHGIMETRSPLIWEGSKSFIGNSNLWKSWDEGLMTWWRRSRDWRSIQSRKLLKEAWRNNEVWILVFVWYCNVMSYGCRYHWSSMIKRENISSSKRTVKDISHIRWNKHNILIWSVRWLTTIEELWLKAPGMEDVRMEEIVKEATMMKAINI